MKIRIRRVIAFSLSLMLISLMVPHTSLWSFGGFGIPIAEAQGSDPTNTFSYELTPSQPVYNEQFEIRLDYDLSAEAELVFINIYPQGSSDPYTDICYLRSPTKRGSCTKTFTFLAGIYTIGAMAGSSGDEIYRDDNLGTFTVLAQGTTPPPTATNPDQPCLDRGGTCQTVGPKTGGVFMRGLCSGPNTNQCFVPFTNWVINDCSGCISGNTFYKPVSDVLWCSSNGQGYCALTPDTGPQYGTPPTCEGSIYTPITSAASCDAGQGPAPSIIVMFNPPQPSPGQTFDIIADATDADGISTIRVSLLHSNGNPVGIPHNPKNCQGSGTISRCVLSSQGLAAGSYKVQVDATDMRGHSSTMTKDILSSSAPTGTVNCQTCLGQGRVWCTAAIDLSSTRGTCYDNAALCLGPINTPVSAGQACPTDSQQPSGSGICDCDFAGGKIWCAHPYRQESGACTTRRYCQSPNQAYTSCPELPRCREACERYTGLGQGVFGFVQSLQTGRYVINSFCSPASGYTMSGYGMYGGYGSQYGYPRYGSQYGYPRYGSQYGYGSLGYTGQVDSVSVGVNVEPLFTPVSDCPAPNYCHCVFSEVPSGIGSIASAVLPGTNVGPRSAWTDPDELQNPPRAVPNMPICNLGNDASITANLAQGNRAVGTELVRAGETLVISGNVEKLTTSCEGYQYECRPWREVGCDTSNRVLFTKLEYDRCPDNFDNVLHQEGGGGTDVNWALVGVIVGAMVCGFAAVACAALVADSAVVTAGMTATAGAMAGGAIGSTIDQSEGQQLNPASCFRICAGETFWTDPAPAPVCSGGRSQVSAIRAKNATVECGGPQSCGPFTQKRVRIRIYDPNGALVNEDFTTTDSEGAFSYTFRAPAGDGEFTAIASVPSE